MGAQNIDSSECNRPARDIRLTAAVSRPRTPGDGGWGGMSSPAERVGGDGCAGNPLGPTQLCPEVSAPRDALEGAGRRPRLRSTAASRRLQALPRPANCAGAGARR